MSLFHRWTARATLVGVLIVTTLAGNLRPLQPRAASAFQEQPPAPFTDVYDEAGMPALSYMASTWGDVDNDGDLDVVAAGLPRGAGWNSPAVLYRNDSGAFMEVGAGLPHITTAVEPALDLGDYDRDGDLDLAISGSWYDRGDYLLAIYTNGSSGSFVKLEIDLPQIGGGSVDWGDYDGDGDLDLLVTGRTSSSLPVSKIYRNDGPTQDGWRFHDAFVDLVAVAEGQTSWGDYDRDGDLDILMSGNNGTMVSDPKQEVFGTSLWVGTEWGVYRNDGPRSSGRWNFVPRAGPYALDTDAFAEWGDFDGDGLLDIITVGSYNDLLWIHRYVGGEGAPFTSLPTNTSWPIDGDLEWGDFDEDGDLDLVLAGANPGTFEHTVTIYRNDAGANGRDFVDIGAALSSPSSSAPGTITWGDYDNDGDLDLLDSQRGLYRNNQAAHSVPQPPAALSSSVVSNTVRLSWAPPALTAGLSYNLRVGTTPGGANIVPSMAISGSTTLSDGLRLLPEPGNLGHVTAISLTLAPNTSYYWSVQTVDASLEGSRFAAEQSFTTGAAPYGWGAAVHGFVTVESMDFDASHDPYAAAWGDGDGDGDFDRAINEGTQASFPFEIQANTGAADDFMDAESGVLGVHLSWTDYNGNGELDLMTVTDMDPQLFRNAGGLSFARTSHSFPPFHGAVAEWGDYDNDGDLDLLLAGGYGAPRLRLLRNDGRSPQGGWSFTRVSSNLPALGYLPQADWGDYDNDGDLDLLLADGAVGAGAIHAVYRNDGPGLMGNWRFRELRSTYAIIPNTYHGDAVWSDYDTDGDLDLSVSNLSQTAIYRNDGAGPTGGWRFTLDQRSVIPELRNAKLGWGDYDADGDPDLAASGRALVAGGGSGDSELRVYRNEIQRAGATSTFLGLTDIDVRLPSADESRPIWVDFDGDGFLDLDLPALGLYRNVGGTRANTPPTAPTRLRAVRSGRSVTFTWRPGGDQETLAAGLTYNLRIGTTPGGSQIMPPMSITTPGAKNGARTLPELGNAQHGLSITLKLRADRAYYWSVQAVDNSFAGSPFAVERVVPAS